MSVHAVRAANFLDELAESERSSGGEKSICGAAEGSVCEPESLLKSRRRELLMSPQLLFKVGNLCCRSSKQQ